MLHWNQKLLLCKHGFCDVSVTFDKYALDVHPRSDFKELAEAVPIETVSKHLKDVLR